MFQFADKHGHLRNPMNRTLQLSLVADASAILPYPFPRTPAHLLEMRYRKCRQYQEKGKSI